VTDIPICETCGYQGADQRSANHRRHHNEYMHKITGHTERLAAQAGTIEVTDIYITLDQLIAHAHGGPAPELTPGAQALLFRHTQESP
jgi:hypothetical protein